MSRYEAKLRPFERYVLNKNTCTHEQARTALYVGRGSAWGNPFRVRDSSRAQVISMYIGHLKKMDSAARVQLLLPILRAVQEDRPLMCFCVPQLCHAMVLASWVLTHTEFAEYRTIEARTS